MTLTKSEKGSLGFTVTKGNDSVGCYIHDIVQDPAKSDGRLRPGDRLIKVRELMFSDTGIAQKGQLCVQKNKVSCVVGQVKCG